MHNVASAQAIALAQAIAAAPHPVNNDATNLATQALLQLIIDNQEDAPELLRLAVRNAYDTSITDTAHVRDLLAQCAEILDDAIANLPKE